MAQARLPKITQAEILRGVKALQAAGVRDFTVEFRPDGTVTLNASRDSDDLIKGPDPDELLGR